MGFLEGIITAEGLNDCLLFTFIRLQQQRANSLLQL